MVRVATVPVFGSTTHTAGLPVGRGSTADGGISMRRRGGELHASGHRACRGASPAADRSAATLTRKVPVTGSARGATSRTTPVAVTFGSAVSATVMSAIRGDGVLDARGHVEHGVARALARDLHDHAAGADDLAGLRALRRHDAGHVGDEPRVARGGSRRASPASARIRPATPRSSAPTRPARTTRATPRSRRPGRATASKLLRASASWALRRGQLRARRLQAALLVLRIEPRDELARPHGVADAHRALEHPAVDAERQVDLGLRLHGAGERERVAACALLDRDRADGADFRRDLLRRCAGRPTAAWPRRRRGRRPRQAGDGGAGNDFAGRRDSEARGSSQWTIPPFSWISRSVAMANGGQRAAPACTHFHVGIT